MIVFGKCLILYYLFLFLFHPSLLLTTYGALRKRKGKKDKSSHGRPGSHADFEASGDDYNDLAKQFGISPDLIRRMQSHSGRLDDDVHVDRHENEKYL